MEQPKPVVNKVLGERTINVPHFHMQNELNQFNLIFSDDEAFIEYLTIMFETPQIPSYKLREFIADVIPDALDLYYRNKATAPLAVYVSTCVKKSVKHLESELLRQKLIEE